MNGGTPIAGWFRREFGGTHIDGNPHVFDSTMWGPKTISQLVYNYSPIIVSRVYPKGSFTLGGWDSEPSKDIGMR